MRAAQRAINLRETLKQLGDLLFIHAGAGVFDGEN
jgi:hypothetical protein